MQELPDCRKIESKCCISSSVTYQAADKCLFSVVLLVLISLAQVCHT